MIHATNDDIGRSVVYRPRGGPAEEGVITGFAKSGGAIFVRYRGDNHSKATYPESLTWARDKEAGTK